MSNFEKIDDNFRRCPGVRTGTGQIHLNVKFQEFRQVAQRTVAEQSCRFAGLVWRDNNPTIDQAHNFVGMNVPWLHADRRQSPKKYSRNLKCLAANLHEEVTWQPLKTGQERVVIGLDEDNQGGGLYDKQVEHTIGQVSHYLAERDLKRAGGITCRSRADLYSAWLTDNGSVRDSYEPVAVLGYNAGVPELRAAAFGLALEFNQRYFYVEEFIAKGLAYAVQTRHGFDTPPPEHL